MTEEFTSIKFYHYTFDSNDLFWSATTDITSDVLHNPRPRGASGMAGADFMDRFADSGEMTIALDNSTGKYSSGVLGEPTLSGALAMVCTWDGISMVKWCGYYKPGSKKIYLDTSKPYVEVSYRDWIGWATDYKLENIEYQTGIKINQAVTYILRQLLIINGNIMPLSRDFETGYYTFVDVFDLQGQSTTIGGELRKLAESEFGYIYLRNGVWGNGSVFDSILDDILVIENREHRSFVYGNGALSSLPKKSTDHDGDTPLLSDGTSKPLLSDGTSYPLLADNSTIELTGADIQYGGDNLVVRDAYHYNYMRARTKPRKIDTDNTTVLWTLETPTMVAAGSAVSGIRGRFRDPSGGASYVNCIDLHDIIPITDYLAYENDDGTGADLTSSLAVTPILHGAEVELTLTNRGTVDLYTGGDDILFQVRGQGVYIYDMMEVTVDMRDVYPGYDDVYPMAGVSTLEFDLEYKTDANDILDSLSASGYWKNLPRTNLTKMTLNANKDSQNMRLWMYGGVGTAINVDIDSTVISYDSNVFINGYTFEVIDGKYIKWTITPYEETRAIRT